MSDDDLSKETVPDEPLTIDNAFDDMEEVTETQDDRESEPVDENEVEATDEDEATSEADDDAQEEEDDTSEVSDEEDEEQEEDGSENYAGGKFASHDAKVTLQDGTVITVGELARNNLFQSDYTRKTEALKQDNKALEEDKGRVDQLNEQVRQQQEYILWYGQNYMPPDPGLFQGDAVGDPVGYLAHQQKSEAYNKHQQTIAYFQQQMQQGHQKAAAQQQEMAEEHIASEVEKLKEADPTFKDKKTASQFFSNVNERAGSLYGFSQEEVSSISDHRFFLVLKDAIAYRRLQKKAPQARDALKGKPSMSKAGRRKGTISGGKSGAKQRLNQLRKTGTFEDGVASLMDFDL